MFSLNLWDFSVSDNWDGISIKANENSSATLPDPCLYESKSSLPSRDMQQKRLMIVNCARKLKWLQTHSEACSPSLVSRRAPGHKSEASARRLFDRCVTSGIAVCGWAALWWGSFTRPGGRAGDHTDRKTQLRKHFSGRAPRAEGCRPSSNHADNNEA